MMEQQGSVVALEGTRALVRLGPVAGCPTCDQGKGCGGGVFGRLLRRRPVVLSLENTVGAWSGSTVRVAIPERLFLGLAARLYLVPIVAALAGTAAGHHLALKSGVGGAALDLAALAGGFAALIFALPRNRGRLLHKAETEVQLAGLAAFVGPPACGRSGTDLESGLDKR